MSTKDTYGKEMKFADNIVRESLDIVYVIRTREEMNARQEANSNLWEEERGFPDGKFLFSTPVRDVKIGENIYNEMGTKFVTYRSS